MNIYSNSRFAIQSKEVALKEMTVLKTTALPLEAKEDTKSHAHAQVLKELGFNSLHKEVTAHAERAMKENLIAMGGYKKITDKMYKNAKERVEQKSNYRLTLGLTAVAKYMGQSHDSDNTVSLPPTDVLEKMAIAKKEGVFDSYSIIHVMKAPVRDPILVGQVLGSNDMYFIAEWGSDISLAEITG